MILDIHGNPIDPLWAAEFRGFFFADGYLGITTNGVYKRDPKYKAYIVRAQITLRDDDIAIIDNIYSKLGGTIHREGRGRLSKKDDKIHRSKPYVIWRVTSKNDVLRVCSLLECNLLPSKKVKEIEIIKEFISTRIPPTGVNKRLFKEIHIRRSHLHDKIKSLHSYLG